MRTASAQAIDKSQQIEDAIVGAVAGGTVLIGTPATLSRALGVNVAALRSALRELLEARKIAVSFGVHGQLTIRLERSRAERRPDLNTAIERSRPGTHLRIL